MKHNIFMSILSTAAAATVAAPLTFAEQPAPPKNDAGKVPDQIVHIAHPSKENNYNPADIHIINYTDAHGRFLTAEPFIYAPGLDNGLRRQFRVSIKLPGGAKITCDAKEFADGKITGTKIAAGQTEALELRVPSLFIGHMKPVLAGVGKTFTNVSALDNVNAGTGSAISDAANDCLSAKTLPAPQAHYSGSLVKPLKQDEVGPEPKLYYLRRAELPYTQQIAIVRPPRLPNGVASPRNNSLVELIAG